MNATEGTVCCGVLACAGLAAPTAALADWRSRLARPALPLGQMRQADEQTVIGLAAVTEALVRLGGEPAGHSAWGVLGAPELLGRAVMAQTLTCFAQEGAWGISPHLIPHRSLHALSGTISQALGLHGPNCGVGGGPGAVAEAFLAAATLLDEVAVPGLWLVCTRGLAESANQDWLWQAVALALTADSRTANLHLEIGFATDGADGQLSRIAEETPGNERPACPTADRAGAPWLDFASLLALATTPERFQPQCWRLPAGGWIRLRPTQGTPR